MPTSINLHCPICSGSKMKPWGTKRGYNLHRCTSCGHRFADLRGMEFSQDPDIFLEEFTHGTMPTDEDYYNHLAGGEAPGNTVIIASQHALRLARDSGARGSWLDVGSGSGHLVATAKTSGFVAEGIEPGGWGQISAKRKGISIKQGFLEEGSFPTPFDVVSAMDVVEHQTDPLHFLRLLAKYVKPGGHLVISIPYAGSPEALLLGSRWNMVTPPTHSQFFSHRSLNLALGTIGFRMLASQQYHVHHRLSWLLKHDIARCLLETLIPGPQLTFVAHRVGAVAVG